jgi:hypothetical protein
LQAEEFYGQLSSMESLFHGHVFLREENGVTKPKRVPRNERAYIQAWITRPKRRLLRRRLARDGKTIQEWLQEQIEEYLHPKQQHTGSP